MYKTIMPKNSRIKTETIAPLHISANQRMYIIVTIFPKWKIIKEKQKFSETHSSAKLNCQFSNDASR